MNDIPAACQTCPLRQRFDASIMPTSEKCYPSAVSTLPDDKNPSCANVAQNTRISAP